MAEPFLVRDQDHVSFVVRAEGLGALQRPVAADQPEPGAVLAARHDVRRRRAGQLRAAGPAGPRADPRGQRPHAGRARRRAGAHAAIAELPTHTHTRRTRSAQPTARTARPRTQLPRRSAGNALRRADQPGGRWTPSAITQRRRQPGAHEHAAVPDPELLHRAPGHLPVARTRGGPTMAQPYVGEIRMFAGNFAPAGWMFCEGQLLPISENETLFQLIGTTYGGDGRAPSRCPTCAAASRSTRATASSWPRRAAPRRSR